ncbi:uncharacterized protein LOC144152840 isoform X2 [Haemaphysalis longicornis]
MKLWFCRKRNNLQLQQNVPPLAMARRDGFRALSLRRKDGGKVKPAQQRSAKKWTLRVKLVAVIFCSFQGAARGVPSAAAGDRKNLKTKYGGVARGVPSAASGDRKNLKTKV